MSLWDKIKPKGVDDVTPMYEIWEELLKEKPKQTITTGVLMFILSIFTNGLFYQLLRKIGDNRFQIGLLNSFVYGVTDMLILSLLVGLLFCYGAFHIHCSFRKKYKKNYEDNYLVSKRGTYGNSHFQTDEELKKNFTIYNSVDEARGRIYGRKGDKIYVFNYPNGMNMNRAYFGAPGSGKSSSSVKNDIYQNIREGNSIIVTDTKGDLYAETSGVARENGYVVKSICMKPELFRNSDSFNIMQGIKDNEELDSKATTIAEVIIKNTEGGENLDYWAKNEFNLFKCVIMHVGTAPEYVNNHKNTLPEVQRFITSHDPKQMAAVFLNYPKESIIRYCYDIFAKAEEKNQTQIINGAGIRLAIILNPYLSQALSRNDVDFLRPMKEKCIYYITVSDQISTYRVITSLFFSVILNEMCTYSDSLTSEEKKKQLFVDFVCDEYKNTGGITGLPIKIATLRSRKIGFALFLQDIGQLNSMYGEEDAATILNCCTIKALLSTNDEKTAEYFSGLLGTTTVMVENEKYSENVSDVVHAKNVSDKSMGEGTRPLKLPSELMNDSMNRSEVIYVISAMAPVKLEKCFAELSGTPIHPFEKYHFEHGEKKIKNHRPKWRKIMEEAQAVEDVKLKKMYKSNPYKKQEPVQAPTPERNPNTTQTQPTTPKTAPQPKVEPPKATNNYSQMNTSNVKNPQPNRPKFSEVEEEEPKKQEEPKKDSADMLDFSFH